MTVELLAAFDRLPALKGRIEERPPPAAWAEYGPCWVVVSGRMSRNGYPRVSCKRRKERVVHRVLWELLVGPIEPGLLLDHKCRVRACCNPAHLEPVTPRTNTHRGQAVLFRKLACE